VKVFRSEFFEWNKDQMLKEVATLMELRHPHIVQFTGFAQGPEICTVLMEFMPEKDLRHYMENHAPFTRSEQLDIITQIAKGMLYLHTQGYVHGDLKCSNILVKKHGNYIEVKIGDLRYAQKLESAEGSSEFETVRRPRWSPPEALEKYGRVKPADDLLRQADVYSFAMTCYEVRTGKWPYDGIRDRDGLNEKIKAGQRPELPADLHSELNGLIESCWASDPNKRPSFKNICVILELIRSFMPAVTNKIANLWKALKQIPNAMGLLQVWQKHPSTTTWNENTIRQSEREPGADGVIKLPACLNIKFGDLEKVHKVGKGAFASMYEAKWLGITIAVKKINKLVNNASVRALQQVLDFLIQLRHPYIIQLVGFSVDKRTVLDRDGVYERQFTRADRCSSPEVIKAMEDF
jgi:serine/threonine protein kinase